MPLVSAGIALMVQTLLLFILMLYTGMGGHALAICSLLYSFMIFMVDSHFICKYLNMKIPFGKVYGKPLAAAAVMGIVTALVHYFVYHRLMEAADRVYFNNLVATAAAIAAAIVVYFLVLIKIGGLTREDLLQVPKGAKVVGVLQKMRLM